MRRTVPNEVRAPRILVGHPTAAWMGTEQILSAWARRKFRLSAIMLDRSRQTFRSTDANDGSKISLDVCKGR
jgi:hypothetical protein